jgi:hypothetical protein
VLAAAIAACGRIGFGVDAPCTATASVDWLAGAMPSDPGAGQPNAQTYEATAEVVIDDVSGLIWQRAPAPGSYTWDAAVAYCASLSLAGCDHWRLPERIELASIVDHVPDMPKLDPSTFPGALTDLLWWSATPSAASPNGDAWIVNFFNGNCFTQSKPTTGYVRCVRATASADAPPVRYQITATTIHDIDSRLTWQAAADPGTYDLAGAAQYCAALALDGGGWRLPSIRELQTLVETASTPAIDPIAFPNTASGYFWSSTPLRDDTATPVMVVDFGVGVVNNEDITATSSVRCVR